MKDLSRRLSPGTLLSVAIAAFAVWLFVELADEVSDDETRAIDEAVLLAFRTSGDPDDPLGPVWVEEMARDVTGLGSTAVLTFVTIAVAGFLLLQRKRRMALYVVAAVSGGVIVSTLLKLGFDRPRPDLVVHGQAVLTASFPSGHSMMSAVAYLTLGVLLASVQKKPATQLYVLGLAAVLAIAVGITRVYLGVHWPTDVLGGWAAGVGWALACWAIALYLKRRRAVE